MERAIDRSSDDTVFIYRKGNGGAFVSKSPAVVRPGGTLWIVNLTECPASVRFPKEITRPRSATLEAKNGERAFAVIGETGAYEYDVTLSCSKSVTQNVEANSRPGVIIDP